MPVNRSPLAYGSELGELWLRGIEAPNGVATPWSSRGAAIGLRQRLYAFRNASRKLVGPGQPPLAIEAGAIKLEGKRFPPTNELRWRLVILRPDTNLNNLTLTDPITGEILCSAASSSPSSSQPSDFSPASDYSKSSGGSHDNREHENPSPDRQGEG